MNQEESDAIMETHALRASEVAKKFSLFVSESVAQFKVAEKTLRTHGYLEEADKLNNLSKRGENCVEEVSEVFQNFAYDIQMVVDEYTEMVKLLESTENKWY